MVQAEEIYSNFDDVEWITDYRLHKYVSDLIEYYGVPLGKYQLYLFISCAK